MIVLSLLLAPVVIAVAALIERRLGPSAAGWVAALPVAFAVAVAVVMLDAGARPAGAMALSAATQVPAQVVFGIVFAAVLVRRGLTLGVAAGVLAYTACSIAVRGLPAAFSVAAAIPALALAPRLMAAGRPRAGSPRRWSTTVLTCVAAPRVLPRRRTRRGRSRTRRHRARAPLLHRRRMRQVARSAGRAPTRARSMSDVTFRARS